MKAGKNWSLWTLDRFDDTLLDVLLQKLDEDGTEVGTGACAYFSGLGLRVAKIKDGKITRIEVIRSIH